MTLALVLTLVFSLLTSLTNAASATLQWDAATKAPPEEARGLRLAVYLVRRPEYLGAIGALTLSFLFQAAALHEGELALVQPLLVLELPFTLMLSALWLGLGIDRRELLGTAAICVGLGAFLGLGRPHGGRNVVPIGTWAITGIVVVGVLGGLVLAARRGGSLRRTVLFALASGVAYSVTALLVKATTERFSGGIVHLLAGWAPYAMIAAGVLSVLLQQQALHAGPLAVAKPATTIINPIVSIALAVFVFQESLDGGAVVAAEVLGMLVLVAGVLELSRSPLVTGQRRDDQRHEPRLSTGRRSSSPGTG